MKFLVSRRMINVSWGFALFKVKMMGAVDNVNSLLRFYFFKEFRRRK